MQEMYIVKVVGGKFTIIDKIASDAIIGPDNCKRF